ncbi:unnamed protein product [Orchesella dallaii]|uniref:Uncharacterized protein n=1 Tax=Orchesella dallaii TaxID=48710 RepID=A0ABP1RPE1_9HEXA
MLGYISTDSMHLAELPKFPTLLKSGYRLWIDTKLLKASVPMLPEKYRKNIRKLIGEDDILKIAFTSEDPKMSEGPNKNFSEMVELMSANKVFIWSTNAAFFATALGQNLMYVKDKYICKMLDASVLFNFNMKATKRVWFYLSTRATFLYVRHLEAGIFQWFHHLMMTLNFGTLKDLQLEEVDKFRMPNPAGVRSTLGVFLITHCLLGCILLLVHLIISAIFRRDTSLLCFNWKATVRPKYMQL